ncbi:MAG: hypothetical protein JJE40_15735 [Vicinamibacteria bacterium]|nr:hypothetical protein [Vicinamibacteria bacterium]
MAIGGPLALVAVCGIDLAGRSMARASWLATLGMALEPSSVLMVAGAATAAALWALHATGTWSADRAVAAVLLLAFSAGMVAQLRLGARLQSDGFYYFAHLRSLWFDRDDDLANDYRLLGFGDKARLFTPTPTGHAQSAWSVGPSLAWAPFFAVGDRIALTLAARGHAVATDGTSYPYRQAVCVAGLFWGLVGLFCCYRLARVYTTGGWAALAVSVVALGSFILWYLVKEPSMAHAPSMAAVAIFTWLWAATRGRRTTWQWAALGLLAGVMGAMRWQNVLFVLLPAIEWTVTAMGPWRSPSRQNLLADLRHGLLFAALAVVGLLPQMLAWKAIYGTWLAVSPISPQIRWWDSHWDEVLWSSRNGLFAMSPVLYVGALGLPLLWRRDRLATVAALTAFGAMVFLNGAVEDWWGGSAFGGRRFDGTMPLLVLGTALALERSAAWVARHSRIVVGLAGLAFVIWNLTLMEAAIGGALQLAAPNALGAIAGRQATTLHRWIGHPFSYPANLLFALRNGITPAEADMLWPNRFLADPARPYGRVDLGGNDELAVLEGWHRPERDGSTTFRWASREATLRVALDHAATLRVQIRGQAFTFAEAPPQALTLTINGVAGPPLALPGAWAMVEALVPREQWRAGLNDVRLTFARGTRPSDLGVSTDQRYLSAAIDYLHVVVEP